VPEPEAAGVSGAKGWRGLGSTPAPSPTPLDWIIGIGFFYVLALVPIVFFFLTTIPELILESHLGLLLLPRVDWYGWPWFLVPYAIAGLRLPWTGRNRVPALCGLLVGVWLVEGALLAFLAANSGD
jgi:hypothetical protein